MAATAFDVQLEGNIKFCSVTSAGVPATGSMIDFSDEVNQLTISVGRDTVDRKPTFKDARTVKRMAGFVESVTVGFLGDEGNASGFWSLVWDALQGATEIYFRGNFKPGATSATNPEFAGFITASDLDGGGVVADGKWISKTWSARNITRKTS